MLEQEKLNGVQANEFILEPYFGTTNILAQKLKVDGFSVERYPRLNFYTQKVVEDPETKKKLVLDMIKESIKETRIRNEICIRNEKIRMFWFNQKYNTSTLPFFNFLTIVFYWKIFLIRKS